MSPTRTHAVALLTCPPLGLWAAVLLGGSGKLKSWNILSPLVLLMNSFYFSRSSSKCEFSASPSPRRRKAVLPLVHRSTEPPLRIHHAAWACSFFLLLATLHGMWGLVPQPGIETVCPALEAWSPNHQTIREVLDLFL